MILTSKFKALVMAMVVAGVCAPSGYAATAKIAVIDVVKVLSSSDANQAAEKDLSAKRDKAQAEIDKLEKPILEKQQSLQARQSAMAKEQFEEEQLKLRQEVREYRAKAQTIQEGLQREALKKRKEIADAVDAVVDEIAEKEGYTLVLPMNITVFSGKQHDISDQVLKRVNEKLK